MLGVTTYFERLPNEIWITIFKFLNVSDIIAIKFLSKRCLEVSFLHQRVKYCIFFAKKLVDSNLYYDITSYLVLLMTFLKTLEIILIFQIGYF